MSEVSDLKKWMEENSCSQAKLAGMLGITRQSINGALAKDGDLSQSLKFKLIDIGIDLFNSRKSHLTVQKQPVTPDMEFIYKERIEDLKFTIELLKDQIQTNKELQEIKSLLKKMNAGAR